MPTTEKGRAAWRAYLKAEGVAGKTYDKAVAAARKAYIKSLAPTWKAVLAAEKMEAQK